MLRVGGLRGVSGGAEMGKIAERGDLVNKFRILSQTP